MCVGTYERAKKTVSEPPAEYAGAAAAASEAHAQSGKGKAAQPAVENGKGKASSAAVQARCKSFRCNAGPLVLPPWHFKQGTSATQLLSVSAYDILNCALS